MGPLMTLLSSSRGNGCFTFFLAVAILIVRALMMWLNEESPPGATPTPVVKRPVPPALRPSPTEGHCLVCLGAFTGRAVYCADCATPHHADCWRYNGKCAVFGCASTTSEETRRREDQAGT